MHDVTRHPADDELFDYATGTLDPAAVATMEQHLLRCAACAGFVAASRAGAESLESLVEPMPAEAAAGLQLAVDAAWRERREAIAALERSDDDAAVESIEGRAAASAGADSETAAPPPVRPVRASRWRRAMPVFAVAVLAVLAGTSVWLGRDDATVTTQAGSGSGADRGGAVATDSQAVTEDAASSGAAVEAPAAGGAPAVGGAPDASKESLGSTADTTASPGTTMPPPTAPTADEVCIATLDETNLALPDGRLAARIIEGPLGLYVVCG